MPNLDKTGPKGQGPRTGRGMGNCPGTGGIGQGRGLGLGRGAGRGFGRFCFGCPFWNEQISKEDKRQILEEEKKLIEEELKKL